MPIENGGSDKRSRILKIAGKLFLEQGFAGTSMGEIAAAGAGSKGTLYVYFKNKEALFVAFMTEEIAARASLTFEPLHDGESPRKSLSNLGRRYIRLVTNPTTSALFRVVVHETPRFPAIGHMFDQAGPKVAKHRLAAYLESCTALGKLDIDDAPMAAEQFLLMCQACIWQDFLFGERGAPTDAEIDKTVDAAVKAFLAAYATDRCD